MGKSGADIADDTTAATVFEAHGARLMALAAALAGPSHAGDIVGSVMLREVARCGPVVVRDWGAYLTRAVVNEVRSVHRASLRREARERRFASGVRRSGGTDELPEVLSALAALPIRQRAVVFLTYWADLTPRAVAVELGISEGSVRKHLARARATLRKELTWPTT
jgi:RNA polymerase sigma factor (sigma-70 family)